MIRLGSNKEPNDAPTFLKAPKRRRQLTCEGDGTVNGASTISNSSLSPFADLNVDSHFGVSVTAIGDLDGDDTAEIAIGAYNDNDGGSGAGAVYVLFLTTEGFAKDAQKISNNFGNLNAYFTLGSNDFFGISVAGVGDLDGDSIQDVACGAMYDDDGGSNAGAAYILYLETSGAVKNAVKISNSYGGFPYFLETAEKFGSSLAKLDDLDGDGIVEIAIGAIGCDDGASNSGSIYIVFLHMDGVVGSAQKISNSAGSLNSYYALGGGDSFGWALASLGDLNADDVCDAVVGSNGDDSGSENSGAVLVIFLSKHGKVMGGQKISNLEGRLASFVTLNIDDYFGRAVGNIGDVNADGIVDIGVGAFQDNDGGTRAGAVYVLMLRTDGNVKDAQKISAYFGGLSTFASLEDNGYFGRSLCAIGDLDGNGVTELVVGAHWTGMANRGAAFVVFLTQTSCNPLVPTLTPVSSIAALNSSNPASSSSITAGSAEVWISIGIIVVIVFAIVGKAAAGIYFKEKELALKSSECIEAMDDPWTRGSSTMITPNDFESSEEANTSEVYGTTPEAIAVAVPIGSISPRNAHSPRKNENHVKNRFRRALSRCNRSDSKNLDSSVLASEKCVVGTVCEKMGNANGNYTKGVLQNEYTDVDSMMREKMKEDQSPAPFTHAVLHRSCSRDEEICAASTGIYHRTGKARTSSLDKVVISRDSHNDEEKTRKSFVTSNNNQRTNWATASSLDEVVVSLDEISDEQKPVKRSNCRRASQANMNSLDKTVSLDSLAVPEKVYQIANVPAQDDVNVYVSAEDAFTIDPRTTQRTSIDFPAESRETI